MNGRLCALGLAALVVVAGALRLVAIDRDAPRDIEWSNAPSQDAFWYLEDALDRADGSRSEPLEPYDRPVWTLVARGWFSVFGAGVKSARALSASLGTLEVLLLFLALRPLGRRPALLASLLLATSYVFVGLSRTALIYGPIAAFLTAAWALHATGGREGKLLGWALLLLVIFFWKAVAVVLVPGFVASHLVLAGSAKRARTVLAIGGALALLALLVLAIHPTELVERYRERLDRYLGEDLRTALRARSAWIPAILGKRALLVSRESGVLGLAPGVFLLAPAGALVALRVRASLSAEERSILAGAASWGGSLLLVLSILDYRPVRYFALAGPPLCALAGFALSRLPVPEDAPERQRSERASVATLATFVLATFLLVEATGILLSWFVDRGLVEPGSGTRFVLLAAIAGAGILVTVERPRASATVAKASAALVLGATLVVDLARDIRALSEGDTDLRANRAVASALGKGAVLAGPYASLLAAGHAGLERRRAYELRGDPLAAEGVALAERAGYTHVALDEEQDRSGRFSSGFARLGEAPVLLARFIVRPVADERDPRQRLLLYRFARATRGGYELSPFERACELQDRGEPDRAISAFLALDLPRDIAADLVRARAQALQDQGRGAEAEQLLLKLGPR